MNDCFEYMLQFLDIFNISKLAQTCRLYNNLCKKHKLYDRLIKINDHNDYSMKLYVDKSNYYKIVDKLHITIYKAILLDDYEVLEYYKMRINKSQICAILVYLSQFYDTDKFMTIFKIFIKPENYQPFKSVSICKSYILYSTEGCFNALFLHELHIKCHKQLREKISHEHFF